MSSLIPAILAGVMMMFITSGCGADKEEPRAKMDNARVFLEQRNYHQAADGFRRVIADNPGSIEAWLGLARASIQLGDMRSATDAYERILRISPNHEVALLSLARFDMLASDNTLAEEKIGLVLQNSPDNTDALF